MNIKILIYIIIGSSIFLGIYLFNLFVAIALLIGFGFGVWWHDWITGIINNYQKDIYLSEKANIEHRKKELESELEKLKKET